MKVSNRNYGVQTVSCNLCGIGWALEVAVQGTMCTGWLMCAPAPLFSVPFSFRSSSLYVPFW